MSSVYGDGSPESFKPYFGRVSYLPLSYPEAGVELQRMQGEQQEEAVRALLNVEIEEAGNSWPFETPFSPEQFRGYWMSHGSFSLVLVDQKDPQVVLGAFYIKSNFPGRCSRIANGGFIVVSSHRRRGLGRIMGRAFIRIASDLGYAGSLFNLVFESNCASIRLWDSLGFRRVGTIHSAARIKGIDGLVNAHMYAFDFFPVCHGASAFVIDDQGQILGGVRKGSHGSGDWATPGGHCDNDDQTYGETASRELEEETGLRIPPHHFVHFADTDDDFGGGKVYRTHHCWARLSASETGFTPRLLEPGKCAGWSFRSWDDICREQDLFLPLRNLRSQSLPAELLAKKS